MSIVQIRTDRSQLHICRHNYWVSPRLVRASTPTDSLIPSRAQRSSDDPVALWRACGAVTGAGSGSPWFSAPHGHARVLMTMPPSSAAEIRHSMAICQCSRPASAGGSARHRRRHHRRDRIVKWGDQPFWSPLAPREVVLRFQKKVPPAACC